MCKALLVGEGLRDELRESIINSMISCTHQQVRKVGAGWVCSSCGASIGLDLRATQPIQSDVAVSHLSQQVPGSEQRWWGIPGRGWLVLLASAGIVGAVILIVPFVSFIIGMLGVLFHETGHALGAFLVARPALPAFDFSQGGGITRIGERSWLLIIVYAFAVLIMVREWRTLPKRLWVLAGGVAAVITLVLTGWETAFHVWMGHGGQLIAAAIFLFRGMTGVAEIQPGERWLYAVIGWGLFGQAFGMCWKLLFDPVFQDMYLIGKRGCDNDFVRLAQEHWMMSLDTVAWLNLGLTALVPVLVIYASRWWFNRSRA